jgi:C4-dicarboxylate-specific signal transduction histidine kinase
VSTPAYYDPQGNILTVDLFEPVTVVDRSTTRAIGFVRATLNVSFIWNMIVDERGANGNGSYAFIVDENGVIVAHTDMKQAFSVIAPFTAKEQQDVTTLQRYGGINIPVLRDGTFARIWQSANPQTFFQMVPPGQTTTFSVISKAIPIVPWTYFVLSPTNVVTALADQQLLITAVIAVVVLCLAAATGLIVGQSITSPILGSVMQLQSSSQALKESASKEQVAATQQIWVVDASRTGLTTIDHYTGVIRASAQRLIEIGTMFQRLWPHVHQEDAGEAFRQMTIIARYIENAVQYQRKDNMRLSDTINLTRQVTEQLASSTESATQAADQMEHVVGQLRHVVGRE